MVNCFCLIQEDAGPVSLAAGTSDQVQGLAQQANKTAETLPGVHGEASVAKVSVFSYIDPVWADHLHDSFVRVSTYVYSLLYELCR
jgi:hypothetical protein